MNGGLKIPKKHQITKTHFYENSKIRKLSLPPQEFTAACHSSSDRTYRNWGSEGSVKENEPVRLCPGSPLLSLPLNEPEECRELGAMYAILKDPRIDTPSCRKNLSNIFWRMSVNEIPTYARKIMIESPLTTALIENVSPPSPPPADVGELGLSGGLFCGRMICNGFGNWSVFGMYLVIRSMWYVPILVSDSREECKFPYK